MTYLDFYRHFKDFVVFSTNDIDMIYPNFRRSNLSDWQQKGLIEKITSKYYRFTDQPYTTETAYLVANKIYTPSYISLESALAYYQLIPEAVPGVTNITTAKTHKITDDLNSFYYRSVKPDLFFGYQLISCEHTPGAAQHSFKIATIEKALLDFLYIHSDYKDETDFESLRISTLDLRQQWNQTYFLELLVRFSNQRLSKRVHKFVEYINHA